MLVGLSHTEMLIGFQLLVIWYWWYTENVKKLYTKNRQIPLLNFLGARTATHVVFQIAKYAGDELIIKLSEF